MSAAGGHLRSAKRAGEPGHRIEGLYDLDTGEQVLSGLNLNGFRHLFRPETLPPPKPQPSGKKSPAAGLNAPSAGRKGVVVVGTLEVSGVVELLFEADVSQHPELFDPLCLTDEKVRASEMGKWIQQCLLLFHIDHAEELGFDKFFYDAVRSVGGAGRLAAGGAE
jgi:hypothetical protein